MNEIKMRQLTSVGIVLELDLKFFNKLNAWKKQREKAKWGSEIKRQAKEKEVDNKTGRKK